MAKKKTWIGRIYLGVDADGKQLIHWVGRFDTKRERDAAVAKAKAEKPWEREAAPEPEPEAQTCAFWADRMIERMETGALLKKTGDRYKKSSVDTAKTALKVFKREFGDRDPGTITRIEAEDWTPTVSAGTVAIVVQLMRQLARAEVIEKNRFDGLSRQVKGRADETPPTEEEMLLLLAACSALGDDYAPMMRALITFAAYTLLRPGELFDLKWENDQGKRFFVPTRLYRGESDTPKSNRPKTIAIVPPARWTRCWRFPATARAATSSATRRAAS
jgi:integrase